MILSPNSCRGTVSRRLASTESRWSKGLDRFRASSTGADLMRNRHSFRPVLTDPLEERVVLSHGTSALSLATDAVHALNKGTDPALLLGQVGAVGDSYTDEYKFYPPDRTTARNWVEILHATRGVRFGQ